MVLIVDDNIFNVELIKLLLIKQKVDFQIAFNGQEAVTKVKEFMNDKKMFDIILMDIFMPIMNGYEASTQIRKLE